MTLPVVNLTSGKVSWTAPTQGTDNQPLSGGDVVTGYVIGLRSLTAVGSTAGVYPIQSPPTAADALSEALSAVNASLKPDNYAVSAQALSANGPSDWATEFQFQGVLPVPLAPTALSAA